ncbi:ATPase [Gallibacterium anatis CCM5995]|uniref:AAA family ATPase n=1 Tax=Gallibacterium anatis TaxID=750 RepID=UPI000531E0CC|nr:AAA family ATPase [Gallibacterium anatis]KGQ24423.1 ATPase [Gallibacterium anatis CCM5995]
MENQHYLESNVVDGQGKQARLNKLLRQLNQGMHEREHILAVSLLAAIAGHNTFLYGPPGTAKSLISRRLACAFESKNYFECLMNRFTTPEEIFGPISLKALKEDNYVRQIEGYLPTADFAFLDEIWKSSPAILNNLLTIINEHLFKNGSDRIDVPLKSLIAASNEIPEENQGLEALYDRFIVRMLVPPIQNNTTFNQLLNSKPSTEKLYIDQDLIISNHEMQQWRQQIQEVQLSEETLEAIQQIRQRLNQAEQEKKKKASKTKKGTAETANTEENAGEEEEKEEALSIYVSDRRWQRAAMLLKASAFCNDRTETNFTDLFLLKYCLWTTPENREYIAEVVDSVITEPFGIGFIQGFNLRKLEKDILELFYHQEDVYHTVTLNDGKEYYFVDIHTIDSINPHFKQLIYKNINVIENINFYIPTDKKINESFHPIDNLGNEMTEYNIKKLKDNEFIISFSLQKNFFLSKIPIHFTPDCLFKKNDKKILQTEKELNLAKKLNIRIKKINTKISEELKAIKMENHTEINLFLSEQEKRISLIPFKNNEKNLKIAQFELERIVSLQPIQYREP